MSRKVICPKHEIAHLATEQCKYCEPPPAPEAPKVSASITVPGYQWFPSRWTLSYSNNWLCSMCYCGASQAHKVDDNSLLKLRCSGCSRYAQVAVTNGVAIVTGSGWIYNMGNTYPTGGVTAT